MFFQTESFLLIYMLLQRNYRFFILFVTSSTMLCTYVFTFTLIHVLNQKRSFWRLLSGDILSIVILAYCFVSIWFVGGLTVFHLYLMCRNQVTILMLKLGSKYKYLLYLVQYLYCVYTYIYRI